MEVLPCPVNVDFSNTRGKRLTLSVFRSLSLSLSLFPGTGSPSIVPLSPVKASRSCAHPPIERASPLFSADNTGWSQLIFARTRYLVDLPLLQKCILSFLMKSDDERFRVGHTTIYRRNTKYSCVSVVSLPIVRQRKGGGDALRCHFSTPCSSIVRDTFTPRIVSSLSCL